MSIQRASSVHPMNAQWALSEPELSLLGEIDPPSSTLYKRPPTKDAGYVDHTAVGRSCQTPVGLKVLANLTELPVRNARCV